MQYKGVLHIHSDYSDGSMPLREYVDIAKEKGISFLFFADHAHYFSEEKFEQYLKECQELSTDDLLFIPGLEYTFDKRMHIVVFGLQEYIPVNEKKEIVKVFNREDSLASYAHPKWQEFEYDPLLKGLDAIEIHNARFDGALCARYNSFQFFKSIKRQENKKLVTTCGSDWHHKKDLKQAVYLYVELEKLDQLEILKKIRKSECLFGNDYFKYQPVRINRLTETFMLLYEQFQASRYTKWFKKEKAVFTYYQIRFKEEVIQKRNYAFVAEKLKQKIKNLIAHSQ